MMQKVRNPQYCIVNITSMFAFWSVGAWLNLLHAWRVRSRLYACERVGSSRKSAILASYTLAYCILSMTVVPFPGFSVMQIRISMLQSFRFGPWEPGNEVKYTARLARTIDVINACESKIVSTCVCLMQNAWDLLLSPAFVLSVLHFSQTVITPMCYFFCGLRTSC